MEILLKTMFVVFFALITLISLLGILLGHFYLILMAFIGFFATIVAYCDLKKSKENE